MDIHAIRSEFPALNEYVWFQNGGVSITPSCVADEHARLMNELLQRGPMHIVYPDEEYPRREKSIRQLADFFDASPDELAVMRGVSEAFQTVLRGMSWQAGDEIIVTADEEAAVLLPVLHLRDLFGVKIVKLPLHTDVARQIDAFQDCLSERTRLVAISHVTTDLGYRLPVSEICAKARSRDVRTFVDLAHSAGLSQISLHDLGCDFAGLLSYKWMYAPYASGLLFVRSQMLDALAVTYAGGRSEQRLDFEADEYELRNTAEKFQYGPWSWPLIHAWASAASWLQSIGLPEIESRTAVLTNRLKRGLQTIPAATLFTPEAADQSAALVSFGVDRWSGESLAKELRTKWNMIVKPLPHTREGLRISIPFFLLEEEIDLLVDAVSRLGNERAPADQ